MKTYDEVFQNVMEATNEHRRKIKRIQSMVSASVICAVCVIGASMYMKLEKPESVPPEIETTTTTVPSSGITDTMDSSNSGNSLSDPTELSYTNTDTTTKATSNTEITISTNTETEIVVFSETEPISTSEMNESSEAKMPATTVPQESPHSPATTPKQEESTENPTKQASDTETKYVTQTVIETVLTQTNPPESATIVSTKKTDPNYTSFHTTAGTVLTHPTTAWQTGFPTETLWTTGIYGTTGICETTGTYETTNIWMPEPSENSSETETTTTTLIMTTETIMEEETEPNLPEESETTTADYFYDTAMDIPAKQTITKVVAESGFEIS